MNDPYLISKEFNGQQRVYACNPLSSEIPQVATKNLVNWAKDYQHSGSTTLEELEEWLSKLSEAILKDYYGKK